MNLERIRNRESNKAFQLKLSNGDEVEVPHMDFVAIGLGVLVVIDEDKGLIRTIDGEQIVEVVERANAPGN